VTIASNLDVAGGSLGLRGVPAVVTLTTAVACIAVVIAAFAVAQRYGVLRMVRLVKEDPRVAESCGIDAHAVRFWAFMAGALLSAVAGILYAGYLTYVSPSVFSFQTLLQIVAFALVGGVASMVGPIAGTALLWLGPQFVPMIGDWRFVAYGVLIIICVLWKPDGLMGQRSARASHSRRSLFGALRGRRAA
jgi:branched-chain amino acid transport system permease protein